MEEWREIPGTDYSVSSEGRVASRRFGRWKRGGWRVLKSSYSSDGYLIVLIYVDGGRRTARVHQIVAEAFLGPKPTPNHQINHKSGTRDDNRVENLEWVTPSENQRHRFDVLKHGNLRGEAHARAKLTESEILAILRRRAAGETLAIIAADLGIDQSNVSLIASGKRWAWLTQPQIRANL